jgi:hypothetical protein
MYGMNNLKFFNGSRLIICEKWTDLTLRLKLYPYFSICRCELTET